MIVLKRDTVVVLLNVICIAAVFFLVYAGRISWTQASAFVLGLVLPSSVGWRAKTPTKDP